MLSKKALWEAQLREYPESVRISNADMIQWVWAAKDRKNFSNDLDICLCLQTAHTIQYSNGVFYRTSSEPNAHVGFRFGLKGDQYLSGWGRWDGSY
jgi:hypothetical protein